MVGVKNFRFIEYAVVSLNHISSSMDDVPRIKKSISFNIKIKRWTLDLLTLE